MGAADIVPGVSGGTVALVLGHYQRLVTAISHIDRDAARMIGQCDWRKAWEHFDGRFLLFLGIGIGSGIVGLASLMHWLLENRFSETMAVFFGLVLASGWIVGRMVGRWSLSTITATLLGAGLAWGISSLTPVSADPSYPYLYFCAMIAICAMILPGISGSFVLLLLGVYHPVTGMIRQVAHLEISIPTLTSLTIFGLGCVTGLGIFTRVLRYLLEHYHNITFAMLLGLMLGSLKKIWPLQKPTQESAALEFKDLQWESYYPNQWPDSLLPLVILVAVSVIVILGFDRLGSHRKPNERE
jgi:putative membrane protein